MKQIFCILILTLILTLEALAGNVKSICGSSEVRVIELEYRNKDLNLKKIQSVNLGKSPISTFLMDFYSKIKRSNDVPGERKLSEIAFKANSKYLKKSNLLQSFLKYAHTEKRLSDPKGYVETVVETSIKLLPKHRSRIDWFLHSEKKNVIASKIRSATSAETKGMYGAVARSTWKGNGYLLEVIISNNYSEPIPYLIPLLIHELQHSYSFKNRAELPIKKLMDAQIVDEAIAFDIQLSVYFSLIKKYPDLFCNFLYPTWSYGDLLVPLSWTMASMEKELKSGVFIDRYARSDIYKKYPHLLGKEGKKLRPDLKEMIKKLSLKYVN